MKNKFYLLLVIILISAKFAFTQGAYMGFTVGNHKSGMMGLRVGTTYMGFIDGYLSLYPKIPKWNNPGFYGGTIKIPFYYRPLIQNYESALVMGLFFDYTAGMIHLPTIESGTQTTSYKKFVFGNAPAMGVEFLRLGKGISFAFPIEIGYGKLHFNQDFYSQTPNPQTGYELISTLYLMTGFKIFLSFNSCDNYIEKLRNGN